MIEVERQDCSPPHGKAAAIRVTLRREQVAALLAQRLSTHEMATVLGVSVRTIGSDIKAVRDRMAREIPKSTVVQYATEAHQGAVLRERELWRLFRRVQQGSAQRREAGNVMAALKILSELNRVSAQLIKTLVSLGIVQPSVERGT